MEKRPYRSVKEAVALYGKRILAPDLYANVLDEMESEDENNLLKIKSIRDELEIAKENLEKAKERSVAMARSLSSLQEELEETKRKLQMLKEERDQSMEDLEETVDGSWKFDFKTQSQRFEEEEESEVHEKRHVTGDSKMGGEMFRNSPSGKKKKKMMASNKTKKSSIFFIGGFFSKK